MDQMPQEMMEMIEQMKNLQNIGVGKVVERSGKVFMPGFSLEAVDYAMNEWEMHENSVFIASYPKTGTPGLLCYWVIHRGRGPVIKASLRIHAG